MARNEPTQHVDEVLASLGGNSDRPTTKHYRTSPVDLRLIGVLQLVPVVDPIEEIAVLKARSADGQAVAEHMEHVREVAGPWRVADCLDDEGPLSGIAVSVQPSVDSVVVAIAEVREQELFGGGVELFEDFD